MVNSTKSMPALVDSCLIQITYRSEVIQMMLHYYNQMAMEFGQFTSSSMRSHLMKGVLIYIDLFISLL